MKSLKIQSVRVGTDPDWRRRQTTGYLAGPAGVWAVHVLLARWVQRSGSLVAATARWCSPMAFVGTILLCALAVAVLRTKRGHAQDQPTEIRLWEGPAPGAHGAAVDDIPTALWFPADTSTKQPSPVLVIFPGGGYGGLAIGHEGYDIADWANQMGMSALVVKYRHRGRGYGHPAPMLDGQRAVRLVRHNTDRWHVDPARVGVIGFSAGGHLVTTLLTHFDSGDPEADDPIDRQSCRPDFGIVCYAVIALGEPFTHRGSQRNLLGDNPAPELIEQLSNEKQVTPAVPPCFVWHTAEDKVVPVENSLRFTSALVAAEVPVELHVFPRGRHGLGLAAGHPGARWWPQLCRDWLARQNILRDATRDE